MKFCAERRYLDTHVDAGRCSSTVSITRDVITSISLVCADPPIGSHRLSETSEVSDSPSLRKLR